MVWDTAIFVATLRVDGRDRTGADQAHNLAL
jgi:hypothetical protein